MRYMIATVVAWLVLAATGCNAHMALSYPAPFRSQLNPHANQNTIDYSMTSPISPAQYPCKGYQTDLGTSAGASVATWAAGGTQNFTVTGGATHGGGSCQVGLSYDKGATFKVMTSFIGSCPLSSGESFDFTVPSDAPTGSAMFGWVWYNKIGNREIYMNCASVTIGGGTSARAAPSVAFNQRPDFFKANLANGCTTVEGKETIYPDPGPDVVDKETGDNSGSLTGTCASSSSSNSSSGAEPAASGGSATSAGASTPESSASSGQSPAIATSVTIPSTSPGVVVPSTMVTVASPSQSSASTTPNAEGANPSTAGGVFLTTGGATATSAPYANSTVSDISIVPTIATTAGSPSGNATAAPSASGAAASSPAESSPVASTPATSAAPSTPASSGTTSGVLSGACTTEGMWNCIAGTSFQRCASGAWSVAQPVAAGTKCTPGQSANFDITAGRRRHRYIRA